MLVQKQIFSMWELTLHHIAVLGAFTYNVINVRYIAYNVIALLAEVNSIFLHTRKLMQMYKIHPMNIIRRLNSLINLITFICCRGFALFCISYGIYMNPDKISSFYSFLLMSSMFIMNILNPILFYILLRNDFLLTHKEINDYYSINDRKKLIDTTYTLDNKKSNYKLTYEWNSFTVNRFHQSNSSKL
ncbi:unnamed protein product [Heterobilharzia americana]|nr:unnamed protein product [Heterobilharzia americana]